MSDLISRRDAINAIVNVDMQVYERDAAVGRRIYLTQEEMIAVIEALPSAEHTAKVTNIHEEYSLEGICFITYGNCGNCGAQTQKGDNFCYECGAKLDWGEK